MLPEQAHVVQLRLTARLSGGRRAGFSTALFRVIQTPFLLPQEYR